MAKCDDVEREIINPAYRAYRNLDATPTLVLAELGMLQDEFGRLGPQLGDATASSSLFTRSVGEGAHQIYRGTIPIGDSLVRSFIINNQFVNNINDLVGRDHEHGSPV